AAHAQGGRGDATPGRPLPEPSEGPDHQPPPAERVAARARARGGAGGGRGARDERPPGPPRPARRGGAARGRGRRAGRLLDRCPFGTRAREHAPLGRHGAPRLGHRGRHPQYARPRRGARRAAARVKVLATRRFPGPAWDELDDVEIGTVEALRPGVEALLVANETVDEAVLALLPSLRLVANYGVGYDRIDVAACRARRGAVTNTPGVLDA